MIVLKVDGGRKPRPERTRPMGTRAQPPMPALCLHCVACPPVNRLGLCGACAARPGIRHTHTRRARWTCELEERLRALAERARQGKELFTPPGGEP